MKVFIVSDNKRNGITLANMVNASGNIGIISENDISEPQQIVSELESHTDSFRLAFVVTDKPIYTCTEANKTDRLRAAVCINGRDVSEAKEALSNVIVLRNSLFQRLNLEEIVSTSTGRDIPQIGGSQNSLSDKRKPIKQQKKQKKEDNGEKKNITYEDYEDIDEERPTQSNVKEKGRGKSNGIFGKLKNSLGIEE